MKKAICACVFFAVCIRFAYTYAQQNETMTIVTYYPSSSGVYQTVRLNPTNAANAVNATQRINPIPGLIYFDYANDTLMYCNMSGSWVSLAVGGSYWSHNTTNTTHVSNNSWSVGIGTSDPNPAYKLHIVGVENGSVGHQTLAFFGGDGEPFLVYYAADNNTASSSPALLTYRARGSMNSKTAVLNNDTLFQINATGYTGSSYKTVGKLKLSADGNFNNTNAPGRISFFTTPPASTEPLERMTIKNNGFVGIGTPNPGQLLDVNGAIRLYPLTVLPVNATGSVYYNSTTRTPAYRDNSTWNNFISEYGSVNITKPAETVNLTFNKTYSTPPLVWATISQKGVRGEFNTWVFVDFVNNTRVRFRVQGRGHLPPGASDNIEEQDWIWYNYTNQPSEINYVVISK